jgi:hypothetical protein
LCLEKSILFTSHNILVLNSGNLSLEILKPAACLCHPKAIKYSLYFSNTSIIEKYSGLLQLATSLSFSSFNTIDGLLNCSVNLPATIQIIQCSIAGET